MKNPEVPEGRPLVPDEVACSAMHQFWGDAPYAAAAGLHSLGGMTEREQDTNSD